MVSGTISLFCSKCFSPFPHGTGSLSVSREYLALPDGPGRFTQNSSCSALLRIPLRFVSLRVRDCHPLWTDFPDCSTHEISCDAAVLQPLPCRNMEGLGSSPFARHYWGNHCLFSFPAGTKMFQFPALASTRGGWHPFRMPGCPIRKRIKGHLHLPAAYRSLSRPSSPPRAKASAMRPCLLFFNFRNRKYTFSLYFAFIVPSCHRTFTSRKVEWRITDSNR